MANDAFDFRNKIVSRIIDLWLHDLSAMTSEPEFSKHFAHEQVFDQKLSVGRLVTVDRWRHAFPLS